MNPFRKTPIILASAAFGVPCAFAEIPPQLIHGPAHTSASPSATLYVDAWPRTIIYEWKRGGTLLTDGPTGTGSFISGAATSELTIRYAQPSDVGPYTVTVSTPRGSVTSDPAWLRLCNGDFNSDLLVDDADFIYFVNNYNILDCAASAMPTNCPGDYNADGLIDDADFSVFVAAYDALVCPAI